jgi:hypothetical protein
LPWPIKYPAQLCRIPDYEELGALERSTYACERLVYGSSGAGSAASGGVVAGLVVAQAVGAAVEVEHEAAVEEPVEQGGGDAAPGNAELGGDDRGGSQVALGDDLEQR